MIARLRRSCLALPEAEERETRQTPDFRVRGKIFCMALLVPLFRLRRAGQ